MSREVPAAQRKRPRQARARATVDAILVAAAHILKNEGFERATTNRIAETAGVSIGSLYQYFPNKHAIFATLRERWSDWFDDCVLAEIRRVDGLPLREGTRVMVELTIALHGLDPDLHNALSGRRALPAEEERAFRSLMQQRLEGLRDGLRPQNLELASFIGVRALEAVIHTTALDEPERLSDPEFAEEVTELLVRYLQA